MPDPSTSDADRWERAQAIFHQAMERRGEDRDRFIVDRCSDDADLLGEVRSLVEAGIESEEFFADLSDRMSSLPGVDTGSTELADEPDLTGRQVGAYRLVRLIGRGGMGAVYQAERADGQFEHSVAVKLLPMGAADAQAHRRFLAEQKILAQLEHPGIARLLDGGVAEDGTPYFVMELVRGLAITDYCDGKALDVDARLELFVSVCEAVAYAHRNLVVHRDLKPNNILVTEAGEVKLLDFGIARLLQADGSVTALVHQRVTPAYGSPEQIRGYPVTTASDVYSLGVLLYELLTGLSPYELDDEESTHTLMDLVCEEPVRGPSGRLSRSMTRPTTGADPTALAQARSDTLPTLRRRLKGDLDTIVLMALRKEPERRYRSAEELAEDVRRHLGGYPVRARPETLGYVASRFVRRHRGAVAGVAAVAAMLTILVVASLRFAVTTSRQAETIALERDKAEEAANFLRDLFESANPALAGGEVLTARDLLDQGAERVRTSFESDPVTRASLMTLLGGIYYFLGAAEDGLDLLEESLALQQAILVAPHEDLAETHRQLGVALRESGNPTEAVDHLRRSFDMRVALGSSDRDAAITRFELARAHHYTGAFEEAERGFGEAVELFRELDTEPDDEYAMALYVWGDFNVVMGDLDLARSLLEESLTVLEGTGGLDNQNASAVLISLAGIENQEDRPDEAERLFRQALEIDRRVYANMGESDHTGLALTYFMLGRHLANRGNEAEGESHMREAIRIYRTSSRPQPDMHGTAATALGTLYRRLERSEEAEGLFREASRVFREAFGAGSMMEANTQVELAVLLGQRGSDAEARALVEEALEAYAPFLPEDHPRVRRAREVLEGLGG